MGAFSWVVHSTCHVLGYPEAVSNKSDRVTTTLNPCSGWRFQMPVHYPRYKKQDYEEMEECKIDLLLGQYGMCFHGALDQKRAYAMGAFLWQHDQF